MYKPSILVETIKKYIQTKYHAPPLTERVTTRQNAFSREVDYLRHMAFHYSPQESTKRPRYVPSPTE